MADYSGTPLPKKLGIRDGSRIALVNAPKDFPAMLEPLPDGAVIRERPQRPLAVIVFFTRRRAELARRFERLARALDPAGGLWIAWPKKSARVDTDLDQSAVMEIGLSTGLVDNKGCAIDETWTALRFVVRRENRDSWPP